jgi:hypothetical protein
MLILNFHSHLVLEAGEEVSIKEYTVCVSQLCVRTQLRSDIEYL